jgi:hypothetical protein
LTFIEIQEALNLGCLKGSKALEDENDHCGDTISALDLHFLLFVIVCIPNLA